MKVSVKLLKRGLLLVRVILIAFVAAAAIQAQTSSVDLSFNVIPDKDLTTPPNYVVQPDNKIIVFGDFQVAGGTLRNRIARFNADGSLDNSFDCSSCNSSIQGVVVQPDGKILVSGSVGIASNTYPHSAATIYRLNSDGSLDSSFTSPFVPATLQTVTGQSAIVTSVQPDGKILVILSSSYSLGGFSYDLYKLNTNGSFDSSFTTFNVAGGRLSPRILRRIMSLSDGKILVASNSVSSAGSDAFLGRYNSNGSVDSTFERPAFNNSYINDFDVLPDGSLIIVGRFNTINGINRTSIAKLQPAGNVDTSFPNLSITDITRVKVLPGGKILIAANNRIYRLNADGSADNSFNSPTNITAISDFKVDAAGRIILYGTFTENGLSTSKFARLNQDGSLDNTFALRLGTTASTRAIAAQADGKIVFAGDFVRVNGAQRVSIARINADGSLDMTFNSGSGFNNVVSKILVQADGKILVVGSFSAYNGTARQGFARLNADGSLDENFNPITASGAIYTIALQSDGKILIGGFFSVNGQSRRIARFNADGTLDSSFNPAFANATINSILAQADGKILVGGSFSGANGFNRANLVRLNADGTTDAAFNAGNISTVRQIEVQTDSKYLIFTNVVSRLNANGSTDTGFTSPTFSSPGGSPEIYQILAQPDGTILIGGYFSRINNVPRSNFVRLRPNGALDTAFLPEGANNIVRAISRQADGKVLVGGDFSHIGGVTRLGIARLNVSAYRPITRFDFDGDGRADVTIFRPSNGNWYILPSQTNAFYGFPFGAPGDLITPADFDGDGKTDVAVWREVVPGAGDKAYFYILNSSDGSFRPAQFGTQGDVPLAGDWDGDGKADLAVYRAASTAGGASNFYYRPSSQPSVDYYTIPLGTQGDKPLFADFDGDGRLDPSVFRPSTASWYILLSSVNQITQTTFGLSTDIPVPADYDGDGAANIAVFRPSNGTWYTSQSPQTNYGAIQFGAAGDLPIPADYDGDGRVDTAVFRPSNGAWYLNRTTSGFTGVQFGIGGDKPAPNAFIR